MAEESPGNPADKRAGYKHGAQDQRHGDHRAGDLFHGLVGGVARFEPAVQPALDVLHHDDGVVDDDADGQHQPEQRNVVEAEAHGGHHGKGADDGHGHGRQGNQDRPPILQEHQDHDADQQGRLEQRLENVPHRLAHEWRRVVGDLVVDALGEPLAQFGRFRLNLGGDVQGVGSGKLKHGQTDARVAVEGGDLPVILRAHFHASDVAHADDADRRGSTSKSNSPFLTSAPSLNGICTR